MIQTKRPLSSKRMWFNTLSIIAVALSDVMLSPEFKAQIAPSAYLFLMAFGALINAYLTLSSDKVVTIKEPKKLDPLDDALRDDNNDIGLY